jgi:hypothetical protein
MLLLLPKQHKTKSIMRKKSLENAGKDWQTLLEVSSSVSAQLLK